MTRLLVTGATGQVGTELVALAAAAGHDVVGAAHGSGPDDLDLADPAATADLVRRVAPEVVVHAAAWTNVDGCELDPARAEAVNGAGTAAVAAGARAVGARVLYLSTDYVFGGTADAYDEAAEAAPLSAYGRSKLAGERALGPGDAVVRTSWVCGRHGANVVRSVLRLAAEGTPLRFVDDQVGRPTFVESLAPALLHLATRPSATGVFHATNATTLSWYGFVRAILAAAGHDPDLVRPIRTAELRPPRPAPRPARSVLVGDRLAATGHPPLPPVEGPLARLVADLRRQHPDT